jgi:hypothetical protein
VWRSDPCWERLGVAGHYILAQAWIVVKSYENDMSDAQDNALNFLRVVASYKCSSW